MSFRTSLLLATSALGGCVVDPYVGPPIQLIEATPVSDLVPQSPNPGDGAGAASAGEVAKITEVSRKPIAAYQAGNRRHEVAKVTEDDADSVRSSIHFEYQPGTVYQVETAPGFITAILLQPGEHILARAGGDSERWFVEEVQTGSNASTRSTLLIKPTAAPLVTNLVITTDRRLYQIELLSNEGIEATYQSLISWRYPGDRMSEAGLVWQTPPRAADSASAAADGANGIAVDAAQLDFAYRIRAGKSRNPPRWYPQRVFHDGSKTFIKFSPHSLQVEAPPLFAKQGKDDTLINYRVVNDTYVVDQVLDKAVLKIGKEKSDQVFIEYQGRFFEGGDR